MSQDQWPLLRESNVFKKADVDFLFPPPYEIRETMKIPYFFQHLIIWANILSGFSALSQVGLSSIGPFDSSIDHIPRWLLIIQKLRSRTLSIYLQFVLFSEIVTGA
jgi:hypothetical protein